MIRRSEFRKQFLSAHQCVLHFPATNPAVHRLEAGWDSLSNTELFITIFLRPGHSRLLICVVHSTAAAYQPRICLAISSAAPNSLVIAGAPLKIRNTSRRRSFRRCLAFFASRFCFLFISAPVPHSDSTEAAIPSASSCSFPELQPSVSQAIPEAVLLRSCHSFPTQSRILIPLLRLFPDPINYSASQVPDQR